MSNADLISTPVHEPDDSGATTRGTVSATRVADILIYLLDHGGSGGVSEISRSTGISKTVVHRILQSFRSRELVIFDQASRQYKLGLVAVGLGGLAADPFEQSRLQEVARPRLRDLSTSTEETATVSSLIGNYCVHIDQVVSTQEIRMHLKTWVPRPLTAGASSKAILAFMPLHRREHILQVAAERNPPDSQGAISELRDTLQQIHENRLAVSFGERETDSAAIASPVFNSADVVVGAVSVCGPAPRFVQEFVNMASPLVLSTAEAVSQLLHKSETNAEQ